MVWQRREGWRLILSSRDDDVWVVGGEIMILLWRSMLWELASRISYTNCLVLVLALVLHVKAGCWSLVQLEVASYRVEAHLKYSSSFLATQLVSVCVGLCRFVSVCIGLCERGPILNLYLNIGPLGLCRFLCRFVSVCVGLALSSPKIASFQARDHLKISEMILVCVGLCRSVSVCISLCRFILSWFVSCRFISTVKNEPDSSRPPKMSVEYFQVNFNQT